MNDFRELNEPKESTKYAYTGWFVAAVPIRTLPSAWLATTGDVTPNKKNMAMLFFASELAAYEAMETYYAYHVIHFPYMAELFLLRQAVKKVPKVNTDGSQTMEFV